MIIDNVIIASSSYPIAVIDYAEIVNGNQRLYFLIDSIRLVLASGQAFVKQVESPYVLGRLSLENESRFVD